MQEIEKQHILNALQSGRNALAASLAGVDDALASRHPDGGGWSILDCVEHLVITEQYLLSRLHAAKLSDQPFEKTRREAKIAALAGDRTRRIEAPEQAHPQGRFKSLGDALSAFDATRAEVMRWVESCAGDPCGDPRCMLTDHLLIEGPVTCSETLIMIAAHPARHAKQIAEIRSQLNTHAEH